MEGSLLTDAMPASALLLARSFRTIMDRKKEKKKVCSAMQFQNKDLSCLRKKNKKLVEPDRAAKEDLLVSLNTEEQPLFFQPCLMSFPTRKCARFSSRLGITHRRAQWATLWLFRGRTFFGWYNNTRSD